MEAGNVQIGTIVKAISGRDAGGYFVITALALPDVYIANGKSRPLSRPKRKNTKHLRLTNARIVLDEITDKKLRTVLREFAQNGVV